MPPRTFKYAMNLLYISQMHSFAVRKEDGYPYFEVIRLHGGTNHFKWEVICGYVAGNDAIQAAEAMEKWEMFGERVMIMAAGVPAEDLPPYKGDSSGLIRGKIST